MLFPVTIDSGVSGPDGSQVGCDKILTLLSQSTISFSLSMFCSIKSAIISREENTAAALTSLSESTLLC